MYHLNNRPDLPKEPEIVALNEIIDASIAEELHLDYEGYEEFHLISATAAFMMKNLKRIVVFCEVVVRLMQWMSSDHTFE